MAKIAKFLLNSIFISPTCATTFEVIGCNDENSPERRPALSFKIAEDYFANNLLDDESSYELVDGFFERTIPEDQLSLSFHPDGDKILLSYSVSMTSNGFAIDDTTSISFGEDSILFQCQYGRLINVSSDAIVDGPEQPLIGTGELTYSMEVTAGPPGGNTSVRITPNHGFADITPTIESCKVSHGEHEVYAAHAFNDDVCFDIARKRLLYRPPFFGYIDVDDGCCRRFSMKTFRFILNEAPSTDEQVQTISCDLFLESIADFSQQQPNECSCYSEDECAENDHYDCATSMDCPDGDLCNFDYGEAGGFCETCPGETEQDCIDSNYITQLGTQECNYICAGDDHESGDYDDEDFYEDGFVAPYEDYEDDEGDLEAGDNDDDLDDYYGDDYYGENDEDDEGDYEEGDYEEENDDSTY